MVYLNNLQNISFVLLAYKKAVIVFGGYSWERFCLPATKIDVILKFVLEIQGVWLPERMVDRYHCLMCL